MLSQRVLNLEESATLAMTAKGNGLKQAGKDVISLSIGEPDFDTPRFIKDEGIKAIEENFTHYTAAPGIIELRKAICKKLLRDNGVEYTPDQIVVSGRRLREVPKTDIQHLTGVVLHKDDLAYG